VFLFPQKFANFLKVLWVKCSISLSERHVVLTLRSVLINLTLFSPCNIIMLFITMIKWLNGRQLQTQLQHLHNFTRPATQHLTTTPTKSVVINSTYQRQIPARLLHPTRPQHVTTSNNTVHSGVITKCKVPELTITT
jgi:hypothetical protein